MSTGRRTSDLVGTVAGKSATDFLSSRFPFFFASWGADIPSALSSFHTPAFSGRVQAAVNPQPLGILTLGLSSLLKQHDEHSARLTEMAKTAGYDVAEHLTQALVDQLTREHHLATLIRVTRKARPQGVGPLARDEVPENPDTSLLLDVTLQYAGVYAIGSAAPYETAVFIQYRWLSAAGELMQSSRTIQYNKRLVLPGTPHNRMGQYPQPLEPSVNVTVMSTATGCSFRTFDDLQQQSQKVWSCMDQAFADIAAEIARDVPA